MSLKYLKNLKVPNIVHLQGLAGAIIINLHAYTRSKKGQ
jgi:hypothetical protein